MKKKQIQILETKERNGQETGELYHRKKKKKQIKNSL
jgi:hypothetical protein